MTRTPKSVSSPLSFEWDEIDALILGLRFVMQRDDDLYEVAESALAKIEAVLPLAEPVREPTSLRLGATGQATHAAVIRAAIRAQRKLQLLYTDRKGAGSARVVWPVAVGPLGGGETLAAWCEARGDFRHFRLDRIRELTFLDAALPTPHRILLADWRLSQDASGW